MRPHAPKTAALAAYDAGALTPARRAQVETHLAACETCREQLAAIRLWSRESARMRAIKAVPVDFARMELALAREAKSQAKVSRSERSSVRLVPLLFPVALAAAVLLTLAFDRTLAVPESAPLAPVAVAAPVASLAQPMRATLVAGAASVRGEGALAVGATLAEGAVLDVTAGEADLTAEGLRVAVLEQSSLAIVSSGEVAELDLVRGAAALRVEPVEGFHSTRRVVVLAAGYRIEAEVAVVRIDLPAEDVPAVVVDVREGRVRITGRGESLELEAPAHFAPPAAPSGELAWAGSVGPVPSGSLVPVRIGRLGAVRWELEGASVEGDSLGLMAAPGRLSLIAFDDLGRAFPLELTVGPEGLVDEGELLAPTAPTLAGFLAPEVLREVIQPSLARVQRCYNQALRLRPDIGAAHLRVRVTLSASGTVVRTRIEGADAPASLTACVEEEAAGWHFPSPGGPMSFDLPVSFRATDH